MPSEHFDVLIVGAGLVRHRRGLSPAAQMSRQELRHPRGPRLHRRHLGSVPLSRHPLRQRHVHAGLFVQAVDRAEGDRRRAADPELCARDRGRERHRQEHPLQPSGQAGVVVVARRALDGGGRTQRERGGTEIVRFTCNFLFMCSGYYKYEEGYTPEFRGPRRFRRPHRASAEMARRPRLCRQARGGDRLGRDRGDAGAGNGEEGGACHHAAALADLCGVAPGAGSARQQVAAQPAGEARLSPDPLAQRAVRDVFLPARAGASRRGSSN